MAKSRERFEPAIYRPEDLFRAAGAGSMRFDVPPFQRDYSWSEPRWRDLWRDVARKAVTIRSSNSEHFLGVLLLQDVSGTTATTSMVRVIDGQQRLLTLSVLLAAIRDHGGSLELDPFKVGTRLRWSGVKDDTAVVLKRIGDGELVDGFPRALASHPLAQAYRYFRIQLSQGRNLQGDLANKVPRPTARPLDEWDEWPAPVPTYAKWSLDRLTRSVTRQLVVVGIHLPPEEQEATGVFEALNGANTPLYEFDKVRVLLYTRSGGEKGEYARLLQPAERQLLATSYRGKVSFVGDQFLYDYTLCRAKDFWSVDAPSAARTHEVVKEQALRVAANEKEFVSRVLKPMVEAASVFPIAVGDEISLQTAVSKKRLDLKGAMAIRAISGYSSGPPVPVVMRLLLSSAPHADRTKRLEAVEAMLVRYILARKGLSPLRSELIRVLRSSSQSASTADLRSAFAGVLDKLEIPDDSELIRMAGEEPIYAGPQKAPRAALAQLLRSLEHNRIRNVSNLLPSGSGRDAYTIEHVFPQTSRVTGAWKKDFKTWGRAKGDLDDAFALRHAMGNLLLLKRSDNSGFGTHSFGQKKSDLRGATEPLLMYASVVSKQMWTADQIENRGRAMARDLLNSRPLTRR